MLKSNLKAPYYPKLASPMFLNRSRPIGFQYEKQKYENGYKMERLSLKVHSWLAKQHVWTFDAQSEKVCECRHPYPS